MRRTAVLPALVAAPVLALVAHAGLVPSDAAWVDREWVAGATGTVDCSSPEGVAAGQARGRVLSGSLLGLDLDTLAALDGVVATSDGTEASASPGAASPVTGLDDAWADPLDLSAVLGIVALQSAGITLPLDTPVGVVGQFAQAHGPGDFVGAAGVVNDSGLLELGEDAGGYPDLASIELKQLVTSVSPTLAAVLDGVAQLRLDVGAVGSRAAVPDACDVVFARGTADREYVTAGLDLVLESPLVSALVTDVEATLVGLETLVNGLTSNQGLLSGIVGTVSQLVGPLLEGLGLGEIGVELAAEIDLAPVRELLVEPVSDSGGVLVLRPGDGTVTVDLAALLAETYPGEYSDGLNGLDPNSSLLGDDAILSTLVLALTDALGEWTEGVQTALDDALDAIEVDATVQIDLRLGLLPLVRVEAVVSGALADLLDGEVDASVSLTALGTIPVPGLGGLTSALVNGLGELVGTAVNDLLLDNLSPIIDVVGATLASVTNLVSSVYTALFLDGVVEVTVNAQNWPAAGDLAPGEWSDLPEGRFDVAALRVGVLDAAGQLGAYLHLARSSVGPLCLPSTGTC